MIKGIGLDIVELNRIERLDQASDRFRKRVLTENELALYEALSGNRRTEFLAGRFAGKEAYAKALGTGIGEMCSFQDIEILRGDAGQPQLFFKGSKAAGFISITHTQTVAAAQIVLV